MNEKFFDPVCFNYHFDYENRLLALVDKFKINLSLFSVFMHFLRCIRSCERVHTTPTYCKVCSRVVDFHFNSGTHFRNIHVTSEGTTLLRLSSDTVCDLDVFVSNADPVFFNYHFDHENRLLALVEKFEINLSLFSVFMYFLRCIRSCERVHTAPTYCKVCSRVVDFHFNSGTHFRNIHVTSEGTALLRLSSDTVCDLDVFVSNADDYFKFFKIKNDFCSYFALFSYPEEIFAAFSSILTRIYVNVCLKFLTIWI